MSYAILADTLLKLVLFPPSYAISSFFPPVKLFFCTLDALYMNPQKDRSSRSSRGKILIRKVSQDPQEEKSSRSSRSIKRKDSQEESFSRASRGKSLKSLKRKDHQDHQDHQEERYSRGFSRGVLLYCSTLICCRLFSQLDMY